MLNKIYTILLTEPTITPDQAKLLARSIFVDLLPFQQNKVYSVLNIDYQSTSDILFKSALTSETKNISVLLAKLEKLSIVTSKTINNKKYWKINEDYIIH